MYDLSAMTHLGVGTNILTRGAVFSLFIYWDMNHPLKELVDNLSHSDCRCLCLVVVYRRKFDNIRADNW